MIQYKNINSFLKAKTQLSSVQILNSYHWSEHYWVMSPKPFPFWKKKKAVKKNKVVIAIGLNEKLNRERSSNTLAW